VSPTSVAIVTHRRAPDIDGDEAALGPALEALGVTWRAVPWDDATFDWSAVGAAILRSPWDYSRRRDEFLAWCRRAASVTALHNPLAIVLRNTEKSYLLELSAAGVPVVPTRLVRAGSDVEGVARESGWTDVVVKPAVSAGSWRTWRARVGEPSHAWLRARRLAATRDVLVQPFLPSVTEDGERALVFIDGAFSHAVRKRSLFEAESVAYRMPVDATTEEREVASRALEAAGATGLLYARVDLSAGEDGRPMLMELELTEPRLFFTAAPARAIERFAEAIARRLV